MSEIEKQQPKSRQLPKGKRSVAVAWAAEQAGTSYGKFMLTLTDAQKQSIYKRYQKHLEEKEQEALSYIMDNEKQRK